MIKEMKKSSIEYENLFFCYCFAFQAITSLFCGMIRSILGNVYKLDTLFVYALLAYLFLRTRRSLKVTKYEFLTILAFLLVWLYSFVYSGLNYDFIKDVAFESLEGGILLYIATKGVYVSDKMFRYMRLAAFIIVTSTFCSAFVFKNSNLSELYSQYKGYQLMNAALLLLLPMIKERHFADIFFFLCSLLLCVATGARGPIMVITMAFVCIFLMEAGYSRKRLLICFLILSFGAFIMFFLKPIMQGILPFIQRLGLSTRTVQNILNGTFFSYRSGREEITEIAWEYIKEHLFFGTGFGNDRMFIASQLGKVSQALGAYPHNIFIELLMQFGIIPGGILILILLSFLRTTFLRLESDTEREFYCLLFMGGMVPLFVSGSYLYWGLFYCLISYSFSKRRIKGPGKKHD